MCVCAREFCWNSDISPSINYNNSMTVKVDHGRIGQCIWRVILSLGRLLLNENKKRKKSFFKIIFSVDRFAVLRRLFSLLFSFFFFHTSGIDSPTDKSAISIPLNSARPTTSRSQSHSRRD